MVRYRILLNDGDDVISIIRRRRRESNGVSETNVVRYVPFIHQIKEVIKNTP